jgi:hypothetical protein
MNHTQQSAREYVELARCNLLECVSIADRTAKLGVIEHAVCNASTEVGSLNRMKKQSGVASGREESRS